MDRDPILLTPGPLTTTLRTKLAMLKDWGSWDSDFNAVTARLRAQLIDIVHGHETHVLVPLQGSGTFSVEAAVATALSKLPADRFASAAEFAQALGNTGFTLAGTAMRAAVPAGAGRWKRLAQLGFGLAALFAVLLGWRLYRPPATAAADVDVPASSLEMFTLEVARALRNSPYVSSVPPVFVEGADFRSENPAEIHTRIVAKHETTRRRFGAFGAIWRGHWHGVPRKTGSLSIVSPRGDAGSTRESGRRVCVTVDDARGSEPRGPSYGRTDPPLTS